MNEPFLILLENKVLQINPFSLRINSPNVIEITEPSVVTSKMFAASLLLLPMASAIIKLAIAVGQAKRINKIPKSIPVKPISYAMKVVANGIKTSLIKVENKVFEIPTFTSRKDIKPPMPSNASGRAREAR